MTSEMGEADYIKMSNNVLRVAAYVEQEAKGLGIGVYLALTKMALNPDTSLTQALQSTGIISGSQRTHVQRLIREAYLLMMARSTRRTGIPPELSPYSVYLDEIGLNDFEELDNFYEEEDDKQMDFFGELQEIK